MPRLYLQVHHHDDFVEDWDGAEFSSLADARVEAVSSAREIMAARIGAGPEPDHTGMVVLVAPFREAIEKP